MTQERSAGEAEGKACRIGSKAANNIVVSSDTRNVAMLATQNTGQGDILSDGLDVVCADETALIEVVCGVFMIYMMTVILKARENGKLS
jgi:hypothetical protein